MDRGVDNRGDIVKLLASLGCEALAIRKVERAHVEAQRW